MTTGFTTKTNNQKGNVCCTNTVQSFRTGANAIIRHLGLKCASEDAKAARDLAKAEKLAMAQRKEARCKLNDEQVRMLRRLHENDGIEPDAIFDMYGEALGMSLLYVKRLLDYTVRSKVLII